MTSFRLEIFSISVSTYFLALILVIVTLHFNLRSFENIFFLQSWFIEELLGKTVYISILTTYQDMFIPVLKGTLRIKHEQTCGL